MNTSFKLLIRIARVLVCTVGSNVKIRSNFPNQTLATSTQEKTQCMLPIHEMRASFSCGHIYVHLLVWSVLAETSKRDPVPQKTTTPFCDCFVNFCKLFGPKTNLEIPIVGWHFTGFRHTKYVLRLKNATFGCRRRDHQFSVAKPILERFRAIYQ